MDYCFILDLFIYIICLDPKGICAWYSTSKWRSIWVAKCFLKKRWTKHMTVTLNLLLTYYVRLCKNVNAEFIWPRRMEMSSFGRQEIEFHSCVHLIIQSFRWPTGTDCPQGTIVGTQQWTKEYYSYDCCKDSVWSFICTGYKSCSFQIPLTTTFCLSLGQYHTMKTAPSWLVEMLSCRDLACWTDSKVLDDLTWTCEIISFLWKLKKKLNQADKFFLFFNRLLQEVFLCKSSRKVPSAKQMYLLGDLLM